MVIDRARPEPEVAGGSTTGLSLPIVMSLSPFLKRELAGREIGHVHQYACIEAWRASGFRVISVNAACEVDRVRAMYPHVEIAVARRDMKDLCGKPLVPLAEMLRVLVETGSRLGGIVNSDVLLPRCGLASWLVSQRRHDLLYVRRRETIHPMARTGLPYRLGFDAFFFEPSVAAVLSCDPFTIGLPWWDYFFPVAFLASGRKVAELEDVAMLHYAHRQSWEEGIWQSLFETFRARFASDFVTMAMRGDNIDALVRLMFEDTMVRYNQRRATMPRDHEAVRRYRTSYALSVVDFIEQMSDRILVGKFGRAIAWR